MLISSVPVSRPTPAVPTAGTTAFVPTNVPKTAEMPNALENRT